MPPRVGTEQTPLLHNEQWHGEEDNEEQLLTFEEEDGEDPKQWALKWKYIQVLEVTLIGLLCPLASSILTPTNDEIAIEFGVDKEQMIGAQSGFVHMLGFGPLLLAPLSETFGRRPVFLANLFIFTLLQIPTALVKNLPALITLRTITGFFGSVGVANGGGTISDMFPANERATVLGFYLLGPLIGPSLGPFLGGLINASMNWRWVVWTLLMLSTTLSIVSYFCLFETYAPMILENRKKQLEHKKPNTTYRVEGASEQPILQKIKGNCTRALRILFTQPIVLIMSIYQAVIFSTMFTMYSTFTNVWTSPPYNFTKQQLALTYLAPATGFIIAAAIIVPNITKIYRHLANTRNGGKGIPEYRLPLAIPGAIILPICLFWFGFTLPPHAKPWPIPLSATLLFGACQVAIFNTTQNYYIDAFEKYAASALAAGAVLRSLMAGQIPLYVGGLFEKYGYGIGMSVFGGVAALLMPAPVVFWYYGGWVRERFASDLS